MVRAFLAIDLPWELKRKLAELSKIEVPEGIKIKWVEEENFHITLKFFGNIKETFLAKIYKESEKILNEIKTFKLIISEVGYFPEKGQPRVVWIGLELKDNPLLKIDELLKKVYKKFKILDNKERFHPHITLFRIKSLSNKQNFEKYLNEISDEAKNLKGFNFMVKELIFFKSTLTSKGPIYEPLHRLKLKE